MFRVNCSEWTQLSSTRRRCGGNAGNKEPKNHRYIGKCREINQGNGFPDEFETGNLLALT
ncbi:hypothetical protein BgiMline_011587, partial [Biomphalaria glabrata]